MPLHCVSFLRHNVSFFVYVNNSHKKIKVNKEDSIPISVKKYAADWDLRVFIHKHDYNKARLTRI